MSDLKTIELIDEIFRSFEKQKGKALPLGNVTSQLFANVYMNEFDQFVKHVLKAKHYFRYCDDFVIVHSDKKILEDLIPKIRTFLQEELALTLHPHKVEIRKMRQGIDFLGYVSLPYTKVIRTKTKQRIVRKVSKAKIDLKNGTISRDTFKSILTSYQGVVSHARNSDLKNTIKRNF